MTENKGKKNHWWLARWNGNASQLTLLSYYTKFELEDFRQRRMYFTVVANVRKAYPVTDMLKTLISADPIWKYVFHVAMTVVSLHFFRNKGHIYNGYRWTILCCAFSLLILMDLSTFSQRNAYETRKGWQICKTIGKLVSFQMFYMNYASLRLIT